MNERKKLAYVTEMFACNSKAYKNSTSHQPQYFFFNEGVRIHRHRVGGRPTGTQVVTYPIITGHTAPDIF
jgi:hypothetical protein